MDGKTGLDLPAFNRNAAAALNAANTHDGVHREPRCLAEWDTRQCMLPAGHDGGHTTYQPKEQDTMGIDLDRHIVIDRASLPALATEQPPSGNGVTYVTRLAGGRGVHSSVGADHARERALEWLAIAEDIEQRDNAETQRKDEICRQFDIRAYEDVSEGPAGRMIDRIYELEQQAEQA
jgi:hypothetical protein